MSASPESRIGKYRWVVCALLFFATTINYVDRQILSLLKPILDDELKWTNAQFGLVNSVFQGAYALSLLVFGWMVDRVGTKIGYAVSIAAWSVAAIGHALVGSITGFVYARIALGLGEGGNFPAAVKTVALWFPKKERALATSLFNSGTNVGAIIAPALIPLVALTWGWRSAFVAAGIAGLVWLLLWFPLFNVPEKIKGISSGELEHIRSDPAEKGAQGKVSWGSILDYRQTWSFMVGKFLTDPVWWFFLIWLPDYFKKTRGLDIKTSWVHLVTIYAIVTVLSIAGGWLTGFLTRRGYTVTRARKTGMFIFACCVLPIFYATKASDWVAVLLIGLAGAAHQAWSANLFTTVSDMFPKRAVASVIGIGGMAGSIGGILFPMLAGTLLDSFTSRGNVTAGYALLFGICGSAYLVAFGVHHLLAPKFEPITLRDDTGTKRLSRQQYVLRSLGLAVVTLGLSFVVLSSLAALGAPGAVVPVGIIIGLGAIAASAFLAVKRFHDLNRPGSDWFLLLVPVYGTYLSFVLLFRRGTSGHNRFGADPVQPVVSA